MSTTTNTTTPRFESLSVYSMIINLQARIAALKLITTKQEPNELSNLVERIVEKLRAYKPLTSQQSISIKAELIQLNKTLMKEEDKIKTIDFQDRTTDNMIANLRSRIIALKEAETTDADIKTINTISETFEVSAKRWEKRCWDIKRHWFPEDRLRRYFIDEDECVKSAEEHVKRGAEERKFYWNNPGGIQR